MNKGRVYWITGLPGSGKTTIGSTLYYRLRENKENVLILDGDILKYFVDDSPKYSSAERLIRAKNYSNICKILSDQGMCVIICTVAMFDSIRTWNRMNIEGYIEIFIDTPIDLIKNRDDGYAIKLLETYGNGTEIELPKDPDYIIKNDGTEPISKYIDYILTIQPRTISDYDRDSGYWNNIYSKGNLPDSPSDFARFTISKITNINNCTLLELGCGNGRDSLFFMKQGLKVTAVDASNAAITSLKQKTQNTSATFVCDDFVKCKSLFQVKYDLVYSRFTLHSITEKQENELLNNIKTALKKGGKLYIEARTTKDDLFGKGKRVSENAFEYNGHYRRFIDSEQFIKKIKQLGFEIEYFKEDKGFSKTEDSDPVLMRIIAIYTKNDAE